MYEGQQFSPKIPKIVPVARNQCIAKHMVRGLAYKSNLDPSALVADVDTCIRELVSSKRVLTSSRSETCVAEELA